MLPIDVSWSPLIIVLCIKYFKGKSLYQDGIFVKSLPWTKSGNKVHEVNIIDLKWDSTVIFLEKQYYFVSLVTIFIQENYGIYMDRISNLYTKNSIFHL